MRKLLLVAAMVGLGPASAHAEPMQLDEVDLQGVAAGMLPPSPGPINISVANPVSVAAPVNVSNQVDVTHQIATSTAVGVNAAIAAFSSNVAVSGAANSGVSMGGAP